MNCLRYIKNINSEWFLQENYVSEWWKILDVDFDDNTDIKVVQKYIKKYAIGYCNEINIGNILNTNKYAIMFKKDEFKFWSQIENKFIIIKEDSLIGKKYGRLTVIERVENYISPNGQTAIRLKCICDCGNEKIVVKGSLISGLVKSCGCLVQETSLKNIKKARDSNNFKNRNQEEFVKEKFTTHITLNKIYKTWNINIKVNNIKYKIPQIETLEKAKNIVKEIRLHKADFSDWYLNSDIINKYIKMDKLAKEEKKKIYRLKNLNSGYFTQWKIKNKDKLKEYYNYYKLHKNHRIFKSEWMACKEYFNNSCAYCGLPADQHFYKRKGKLTSLDFHKEHVENNGENDLSNCVPACKTCNVLKSSIDFIDWYNEDNIVFSSERKEKILQWLNEDYKLYIKPKTNKIVF